MGLATMHCGNLDSEPGASVQLSILNGPCPFPPLLAGLRVLLILPRDSLRLDKWCMEKSFQSSLSESLVIQFCSDRPKHLVFRHITQICFVDRLAPLQLFFVDPALQLNDLEHVVKKLLVDGQPGAYRHTADDVGLRRTEPLRAGVVIDRNDGDYATKDLLTQLGRQIHEVHAGKRHFGDSLLCQRSYTDFDSRGNTEFDHLVA